MIKQIYRKYGDTVFRMALTHLCFVGIDALKSADIEAIVRQIRSKDESGKIMTNELEERIVRCAAELSQLNFWDIMMFVKGDLAIEGIETTAGKIVNLRHNATEELIATLVVPSDTDEDLIDEAEEGWADALEEYIEENGDAVGFDFFNEAVYALKKRGITVKPLAPHTVMYI